MPEAVALLADAGLDVAADHAVDLVRKCLLTVLAEVDPDKVSDLADGRLHAGLRRGGRNPLVFSVCSFTLSFFQFLAAFHCFNFLIW